MGSTSAFAAIQGRRDEDGARGLAGLIAKGHASVRGGDECRVARCHGGTTRASRFEQALDGGESGPRRLTMRGDPAELKIIDVVLCLVTSRAGPSPR